MLDSTYVETVLKQKKQYLKYKNRPTLPLLADNKAYGTNHFEGESNQSNAYKKNTHLHFARQYIE